MQKNNPIKGGLLRFVQPTITKMVGGIIDIFIHFINLFISMYLSELLVQTPIFGGAVYLAAQVWINYTQLFSKHTIELLPTSIRNKGFLIFIFAAILNVVLILVYPRVTVGAHSILLIFSVGVLIVRFIATEFITFHFYGRKWRNYLLFGTHTLFVGIGILFASNANLKHVFGTIVWCISLSTVPLLLKQLFIVQDVKAAAVDALKSEASPDSYMEVSSYRIYNRTVVSVFVSINITITMYICYLRYLPYTGFLSSLIGLVIWLAYVLLITVGFTLFLRRKTGLKYLRPSLFVFGLLMWVLSTMMWFRNGPAYTTGYGLYILGGFYGIGLACILSIIISLGTEVKSVLELGVDKFDNGAYERNTQVMLSWSILLSSVLLLVVLTIASFILDGTLMELGALISEPTLFQIIITLFFPMFCAIVALLSMALQPLDKEYVEKLRIYRRNLERGELNEVLEARLKKVLVASYPKRIGIRVVKFLARPFVPLKIKAKENVHKEDMPIVFVCNHMEIYGPIAAVVRLPYYFRPWIIHRMLDKEIIVDGMKNGVDQVFKFLPASWRLRIRKMVAPLVYWIVSSLDPIPVYRDNHREIINTIRLTVEALECEDNILIFPENPRTAEDGKYATEGVNEFFTGFSSIGRKYYQKTGKSVTFMPIFISKQNHTLTFGNGVVFNPENSKGEEKGRIVNTLHSEMSSLAEQNK